MPGVYDPTDAPTTRSVAEAYPAILAGLGAKETAGFMQAVADCHPLGYSLYAFSITRQATWTSLTAPPPAGSAQSCS